MNTVKDAITIALFLALMSAGLYPTFYHFNNPAYTNMQIFKMFWPNYAVAVILAVYIESRKS